MAEEEAVTVTVPLQASDVIVGQVIVRTPGTRRNPSRSEALCHLIFVVFSILSHDLMWSKCVYDSIFVLLGQCRSSTHMEAPCCGSLLGLVLRCGSLGGLNVSGKDSFLSDGSGEPAGRVGDKFSSFRRDDRDR